MSVTRLLARRLKRPDVDICRRIQWLKQYSGQYSLKNYGSPPDTSLIKILADDKIRISSFGKAHAVGYYPVEPTSHYDRCSSPRYIESHRLRYSSRFGTSGPCTRHSIMEHRKAISRRSFAKDNSYGGASFAATSGVGKIGPLLPSHHCADTTRQFRTAFRCPSKHLGNKTMAHRVLTPMGLPAYNNEWGSLPSSNRALQPRSPPCKDLPSIRFN